MAFPLRREQHGKLHSRVITWLGVYQAMTPAVDLSLEPTVRLDLENELQPDAVLFIGPSAGGQTCISPDGYIEGSPALIVAIAASSAAIDTGSKKQVYRRNGVLEYAIWQAYENQLEWFWLTDGEYQVLLPDADGHHSQSGVSRVMVGSGGVVESSDGMGAGGAAARVAVN